MKEIQQKIDEIEVAMRKEAKDLNFERAAVLRDELKHLQKIMIES
jgi:excinuclease UvrABC helicase subunit UvrB